VFTINHLLRAESIIRKYFPPTPLILAPELSEKLQTEVYLKLETVTPIRVFKIRGALVKIQSLIDDGIEGGVITASAGNHGLAVARAAKLAGRSSVVCVPKGANRKKMKLIEAEGAQIIEDGEDYQASFENCLQIAEDRGLTVIHAYDDPHVINGQGTIGVELANSGIDFDTVIMGIGGGGLVSGVGLALNHLRPNVRVIGVEPEGANAMSRSIEVGEEVELEKVSTIADGLAARKPGKFTFQLTQKYVDRIYSVSEENLLDGMRFLLHKERLIAEPAGIAGTAALLRYGGEGLGKIVVVVTGAHPTEQVLRQIF
jgi:threonine dehydratase